MPKLSLLLNIVVAITPTVAVAATTTLDFETFAPGTHITTQYANQGVIFPQGAFIETNQSARSGSRVLQNGENTREFDTGPLVMQFLSAQKRVRLFASSIHFGSGQPGVLRAYDATGGLIAQDGPKPVNAPGFTTVFEVTVPGNSIVRAELEIGIAEIEAIDDLEFEGAVTPPPPPVAPTVQITSPTDDQQIDSATITVSGVVVGEQIFPTATLTIESLVPPEVMISPSVLPLPLIMTSGNSSVFSQVVGAPLGPIVLTIQAENAAGKGTASVRFTNLPASIRTKYALEGGMNSFGNFRWAGSAAGCTIAIYENGAISTEGGSVQMIRGDIFNKWLSLRDIRNFFVSQLGCPTSGESSLLLRQFVPNLVEQDFHNGRIYAGLPTGAHYVPQVFVDAIDRLLVSDTPNIHLGGVITGLPVADPSSNLAKNVGLFQQFQRFGKGDDILLSTLEISGNPPRLWVERQGGDLTTLAAAGVQLNARTATIVEDFPCADYQGPCTISSPPPAGSPPNFPIGKTYCSDTTYPFGSREWSAIRGDYVLTPMLGFVRESKKASWDNPLAHEYCSDNGTLLSVADPGCSASAGGLLGNPCTCSSDWNLHVAPFPPYKFLFAENTDDIELEVEQQFVNYFYVLTDFPNQGDLLFTSGRWIVDCGHSPFNSEIHPPSVMALMRTTTYRGVPATEADIWVGGFYPGDPVEVNIFPPPRPSPDVAVLHVIKPVDSDAAVDVNVDLAFPFNYARVRFSASPRRVPIVEGSPQSTLLPAVRSDRTGEMKWQDGRGYYGRWRVFWGNN